MSLAPPRGTLPGGGGCQPRDASAGSLLAAPITTARLVLEPLRVAHADELVGVLADPALYHFIGGAPLDWAGLRARYERLVVGRSPAGDQRWLNWCARHRESGHALGTMQATVATLDDRESGDAAVHAWIAWVVGVSWQGRGYASEAAAAIVRWLFSVGVHDVRACVHPLHQASMTVARRAGLTPSDDELDGERVHRARRAAGPPTP